MIAPSLSHRASLFYKQSLGYKNLRASSRLLTRSSAATQDTATRKMMVKRVLLRDYAMEGPVQASNFTIDEAPAPDSACDDGVLVELVYTSVDPYMRGRFRPGQGYFVPGFEIGQPITAFGIARVIDSKAPNFAAGDYVSGLLPWAERATVEGPLLGMLNKVDPSKAGGLPLSVFLGPLGMVGLTAYGSIKTIAKPKAGEVAFVAGAAGAVGYIAGQLLKNVYGCRIVGSAGSDEKVAFLKKCGYDEAWNYKTMSTADGLKKYAPEGIDIYFDNVGGETLEAAIEHMRNFGRIVACGAISDYDNAPEKRYGVKNLPAVVSKRLLMQGFICGDFDQEIKSAFITDMSQYLAEKKVTVEEHLFQKGMEHAGEAFIQMMKGANTGKSIVQVGSDPFRS